MDRGGGKGKEERYKEKEEQKEDRYKWKKEQKEGIKGEKKRKLHKSQTIVLLAKVSQDKTNLLDVTSVQDNHSDIDKGEIKEKAGVAVADSADIPYHLWRNHIEQVLPRIKLPADWETRVTPLRQCMLRW